MFPLFFSNFGKGICEKVIGDSKGKAAADAVGGLDTGSQVLEYFYSEGGMADGPGLHSSWCWAFVYQGKQHRLADSLQPSKSILQLFEQMPGSIRENNEYEFPTNHVAVCFSYSPKDGSNAHVCHEEGSHENK